MSATDDPFSQDAESIVTEAKEICAAMGMADQIEHQRYERRHSLTPDRFDAIVNWLLASVE